MKKLLIPFLLILSHISFGQIKIIKVQSSTPVLDTTSRYSGLSTIGQRVNDSLQFAAQLQQRVNFSDTAAMLAPYQHKINLTTTGSSGASTFNQATGALNIPSYNPNYSTGLTNSAGVITNNLSTGVSGGQSIIGGTDANSILSIKGNSAVTGNTPTSPAIQFNSSTGSNLITITNNGKLGIGTTNPSLVSGSSNAFLEFSGTTNPGFALRNTTGSKQFFFYVGSAGSNVFSIYDATSGADRFGINTNGGILIPAINTGYAGSQTINLPMGRVQFAAGATTLIVTNSLASTTSNIFLQVEGTDATATTARVTKAAGSFTITLNAAATAATIVSFSVTN